MPIGCHYPVLSLTWGGTLLSKMPSSVSQMQHRGSSAPSQLNTSTAFWSLSEDAAASTSLGPAQLQPLTPAPQRRGRARAPPCHPRGRPLVTAAQRHGARPAQPTVSPGRLRAAVPPPLRLFPLGVPAAVRRRGRVQIHPCLPAPCSLPASPALPQLGLF